VTRFDTRAIENIATAPATTADRRWAGAAALALVALFIASIPFSPLQALELPAFVPSVVGAGIVALVLTAVLFYVQYRIERDLKLALLALGYGFAAFTQTLYVLTFPGSSRRPGSSTPARRRRRCSTSHRRSASAVS